VIFPLPFNSKISFIGTLQVPQLWGSTSCGRVPLQCPRVPGEQMLTDQKVDIPGSHCQLASILQENCW
jgi:hypothetical protein